MERIQAVDYHDIAKPITPRLAPDGTHVAFVRRIPTDDESYEATIYLVGTDGSDTPRQFSLQEGEDADPRWSPSGDRIAFTSTRGADDDRQQLWVLPIDGGEARQVTDVVGGVTDIAWSPDGTRIAFTQSVTADDRDEGRDLSVPDEYEPEDPDPRVIERTVYRSAQRYFDGRHAHLYLVDLEKTDDELSGDAMTRLTTGTVSAASPAWIDETSLYYTDGWVGDDPDDSIEYDIIRYDLTAEESTHIHRASGWGKRLAVDDIGRVVFPTVKPERASLQQTELDLYDPSDESCSRITEDFDRTVAVTVAPQWGPNDTDLYFVTPDEGSDHLWAINPTTETTPRSVIHDGRITGFDVGPESEIAITMSEWDHPGDVFVVREEARTRLTHLNRDYLEDVHVGTPKAIEFASPQGTVEGWVLRPPAVESDEPTPLIVEVHGGPHSMWTTSGTMWHEFQTLAARGYTVFWSNPRGSTGYGREYMQAIDRNWGEVTLTDVLAGVDYVCEHEAIDEDEVYVTGGSFGGFMTGWAVGTTDRFTAAVAQRGVYDLLAFYGGTDGAYKLLEGDFDTTPWEEPTFLWEQSPVASAHRVTTPTLVIHSDTDYRTPVSTAELFYRLLRKHDVDTRFVRYPREGHELSRSGEPAHVVDRIERIARWFDGYSGYHDVPPALEREPDAGLSVENDDSADDAE